MHATQVLDALDAPADAAGLADGLVRASLTESAALRALDAVMYPADPDAVARQRSRSMFDAWERWASDAEGLMRRVRHLRRQGADVAGAEALRRELGFARCLLGMTLERIESARQQVERGDVVSAEEARRGIPLPAGR